MNDEHDRDEATEARIRSLLQSAGPRSEPTPDRAAKVRSAVHAEWKAALARRSLRKQVVISAALAATLAALAILSVVVERHEIPPPTPSALAATVERAIGPSRLHAGDRIAAGTLVVTGADERLALRLVSGYRVRVDHETTLRVREGRILVLEEGAVFVDSGGTPARSETLEIETRLGMLSDIGTRFEARLVEGRLEVRVSEGAVLAKGERVERGQELQVDSNGRVTRSTRDSHRTSWSWIEGIAPMPRIEGRPLIEFLDWAAREKDLALRFDSEETRRAAPRIALSGSIEEMSIDEALESVLATCGLRYRIEGNALLVVGSP